MGDVGEECGELTLLDVRAPRGSESTLCVGRVKERRVSIEAVGRGRGSLREELIEDSIGYDGRDSRRRRGATAGAWSALATCATIFHTCATIPILATTQVIGTRGTSCLASALLCTTDVGTTYHY